LPLVSALSRPRYSIYFILPYCLEYNRYTLVSLMEEASSDHCARATCPVYCTTATGEGVSELKQPFIY
jgi:hypothetical protein